MRIEAKLQILDGIDDVIKTPWKNGYYYSTKATQMLQKFEGNTAEAYSHLCLDFPDLKPMGPPGTITYGDFGPAHEKIQRVSGGIRNYNVEIVMYQGEIILLNLFLSIILSFAKKMVLLLCEIAK